MVLCKLLDSRSNQKCISTKLAHQQQGSLVCPLQIADILVAVLVAVILITQSTRSDTSEPVFFSKPALDLCIAHFAFPTLSNLNLTPDSILSGHGSRQGYIRKSPKPPFLGQLTGHLSKSRAKIPGVPRSICGHSHSCISISVCLHLFGYSWYSANGAIFFKLGGASFSKPHSPEPPHGCRPLCHGFVRFFVFFLKNLLAFFLSVMVHLNEGRELVQERMSVAHHAAPFCTATAWSCSRCWTA